MEVKLLVSRKTERNLNEGKRKEFMDKLIKSVNRADAQNTTAEIEDEKGPIPIDGEKGYRYSFVLVLKNDHGKSENSQEKRLKAAVKYVKRTCSPVSGWELQGDAADFKDDGTPDVVDIPLFVPDVLEMEHFAGIYEREPHIRIIHDGVKNYAMTKGREREHVLLYGDPASCKTEMLLRLKDLYEQDDMSMERVCVINATTLSKAGLEQFIYTRASSGSLPKVLFFDEIEKIEPAKLGCLLQIMDRQGKISRMNARDGKLGAVANCLVWASTNNLKLLETFLAGALVSRFTKHLPCVRPSAPLMRKILIDKIADWRNDGYTANDKWADIVMEHASKKGINDPRKILGFLSGRQRLEDGSYLSDLQKIEDAATLAAAWKKEQEEKYKAVNS